MHLLPTNLAPLASHCDKTGARMGLTGVSLRVHGDNTFRAMASSGRQGIIVTGDCVDTVENYPSISALVSSPNGETESIVPAGDWKRVFSDAKKLTAKTGKPLLQSVPVVIGKHCTSFGATNLEGIMFAQPRNVDGKFPNLPDVIPAANKAYASVLVNGELLASVLKTVSDLGSPDDGGQVTIELHGETSHATMIAVRASKPGMRVDAAVVPLSRKDTGKRKGKSSEPASEIETLRAQLAAERLRAADAENARDYLQRQLDEARAERDAVEKERDLIRNYFDHLHAEATAREATPQGQLEKVNGILRKNFDALLARMKDAGEEIADLKDQLHNAQVEQEDRAGSEMAELKEQVKDLQAEIKHFEKEREGLVDAGDYKDLEAKHTQALAVIAEHETREEEQDAHLIRSREMYRQLVSR